MAQNVHPIEASNRCSEQQASEANKHIAMLQPALLALQRQDPDRLRWQRDAALALRHITQQDAVKAGVCRLHWACAAGDLKAVMAELQAGADPNVEDPKYGFRALDLASEQLHVVQVLVGGEALLAEGTPAATAPPCVTLPKAALPPAPKPSPFQSPFQAPPPAPKPSPFQSPFQTPPPAPKPSPFQSPFQAPRPSPFMAPQRPSPFTPSPFMAAARATPAAAAAAAVAQPLVDMLAPEPPSQHSLIHQLGGIGAASPAPSLSQLNDADCDSFVDEPKLRAAAGAAVAAGAERPPEAPSVQLYIIPSTDLEYACSAGTEGGFGQIWQATLGGKQVVVKNALTSKDAGMLLHEAGIFEYLQQDKAHPNMLHYFGIVARRKGRTSPGVVLARCRGSLWDVMEGRLSGMRLDGARRFKVAKQAAEALRFMHERGVMHRDFKSDNVLLDEHFDVKVCDLGLSQILPLLKGGGCGSIPWDSECGNPVWLAPEVWFGHDISEKVDVWAYGVLLYRLATWLDNRPEVPYGPPSPTRQLSDYLMFSIARSCSGGVMPEHLLDRCKGLPRSLNGGAFLKLLRACLQEQPEKRASFKDICEELLPELERELIARKRSVLACETAGSALQASFDNPARARPHGGPAAPALHGQRRMQGNEGPAQLPAVTQAARQDAALGVRVGGTMVQRTQAGTSKDGRKAMQMAGVAAALDAADDRTDAGALRLSAAPVGVG